MIEQVRSFRWRIGIAMLVAACMLTGAWLSSVVYMDTLLLPYGRSAIYAGWFDGFLCFGHGVADSQSYYGRMPIWDRWQPGGPGLDQHLLEYKWTFRFGGMRIGYFDKAPPPLERAELIVIPFWLIVIPLSLLSAYLLIRKPRPTTKPPG